jgi:hypothetical protein
MKDDLCYHIVHRGVTASRRHGGGIDVVADKYGSYCCHSTVHCTSSHWSTFRLLAPTTPIEPLASGD